MIVIVLKILLINYRTYGFLNQENLPIEEMEYMYVTTFVK